MLNLSDVAGIDPYDFYDRTRASGKLVWDESMKGWLVTTYEDCKLVEQEEHRFRHPYADADQTLIDIKGGRRNITILQGEAHARMHRFLMRLFSPRLIAEYRTAHVRPVIESAIDHFINAGRTDLAASFSGQIPPRVMMSLFAMEWRDEALARRVFALHDEVMTWIGKQNSGHDETARAAAAAREITAILLPDLMKRKLAPGNDLISRIWLEGPAVLPDFSDDDALATARELFLAGTDTTVHAMNNALYVLLTQPALMERVRSDRSVLPAFVEEVLRVYGSVQYRFRVANEDCEVGGSPVRKGDVLILINAAANRDPARYAAPADLKLDRSNPKDHLAFNAGPRTCVGAGLARLEMVEGLDTLLSRVKNLALDPSQPGPRFAHFYTRSFQPLHVTFDI